MNETTGARRPTEVATAVAAAAVLLSGLATISMAPRAGQVARATIELAVVAIAVLAVARLRDLRRVMDGTRRLTIVGLGLYLVATLLGTVVALARGNDPVRLAGQLLTLGLLPLAAATLLAPGARTRWRALATGLSAAFALCATTQLVGSYLSQPEAGLGTRFALPDGTSFGSTAAFSVALAVCLLRAPGRPRHALGAVTVGLAVVLVPLALVRTHMIGLVVVTVVFVAFSAAGGRRPLLRLAGIAAGCVLALVLLLASVWLWWRAPRATLPVERTLPPPVAESTTGQIGSESALAFLPLAHFAAPRGDLLRVRGHLECGAWMRVDVLLRRARPGSRLPASSEVNAQTADKVPLAFTLLVTGDGDRLTLGARRPANATCRLIDVSVEQLGSAFLAPVVTNALVALRRSPDPAPEGASPAFATDASLAFRSREAAALIAEIRSGSLPALLLGRGLGATFHLDTAGFDAYGRVVRFGDTNYIHNLYLFLAFKLGLLGTALYIAALGLWGLDAMRLAFALPRGSAERLFAVGAVAVWASAAVMGMTAPHLVEFQSTPLFGFLLAATARLPTDPQAQPADSP